MKCMYVLTVIPRHVINEESMLHEGRVFFTCKVGAICMIKGDLLHHKNGIQNMESGGCILT